MPHPWALVDSSFPTLREGEKPQDQITALVDYMMILTEALKYQLENLDTNNWNTAALDSFQLDTTADVREQIAAIAEKLKTLTEAMVGINDRLTEAEGLMGQMEAELEETGREIESLREQTGNAQADIDELQRLIGLDEEGNIVIGETGSDVHLKGNVYINGVRLE